MSPLFMSVTINLTFQRRMESIAKQWLLVKGIVINLKEPNEMVLTLSHESQNFSGSGKPAFLLKNLIKTNCHD